MTDLKPLNHHTVGSVRPAATQPGGASALAVVYVDGPDGSPAGTVVVDLHRDAVSTAAAEMFADALSGVRGHVRALEVAEQRARSAEAARDAAFRAQNVANARLARVLTGRSLTFGKVLVSVAADGSAWMQDPAKGDAGFGLHFADLATLWRCHPELRPVRWADGRLVCAALSMEER
jgi:hypothetical protein